MRLDKDIVVIFEYFGDMSEVCSRHIEGDVAGRDRPLETKVQCNAALINDMVVPAGADLPGFGSVLHRVAKLARIRVMWFVPVLGIQPGVGDGLIGNNREMGGGVQQYIPVGSFNFDNTFVD